MFSTINLLTRWALALFLVFGTYNTTGYSYYHWLGREASGGLPLKLLIGIFLVIAFAVLVQAVWRSLGPWGIAITLSFLTSVVWTLQDYRVIDLDDDDAIATTVAVIISTLIAFGVSWSHQRMRISGQIDAKDVNLY